jgi:hypothetical protein
LVTIAILVDYDSVTPIDDDRIDRLRRRKSVQETRCLVNKKAAAIDANRWPLYLFSIVENALGLRA